MEDKTEQQENETKFRQNNQLKVTLLANPEGRILLIGVALAFIYTCWLVIKVFYSPDESHVIIGMTAFDVMFGRAPAMIFGYSQGLGHAAVITVCVIVETILVLLVYPLFVFSWRHLLVIKWLKNTFERIHKAAETHKDKVQKYGMIGLFVFVWLPFWMTGPVVGCVIGFLLGLKAKFNIPVVLAGTFVAIFGWAFFMHRLNEQVASYSSYAGAIILVLLIVIVVVGNFLHKTHQENKKQNSTGQ